MVRLKLVFNLFLVVTFLLLPAQFTDLKAEIHDDHNGSGKGPFIGTWYGTFFGVPTILTVHADGSLLSYNSDSLGQGGGQKSPILGAWAKTGPRSFRMKGIIFSLDLDGNIIAVVQLNAPAEVSEDGMQMSMLSLPKVFFCAANDDCPNPVTDEPDFVYPAPIPLEWNRVIP